MKYIFVVLFSILSHSALADTNSIKDFKYNGYSFNTTQDELRNKGFECNIEECSHSDKYINYNFGFLSPSGIARNGVTLQYYENHVKGIKVEQLIPTVNDSCSFIVTDIKDRFNKKYNAELKNPVVGGRFPTSDAKRAYGRINLGKDYMSISFECLIVPDEKDKKKQYVYLKSIFNYDNMATNLLINDF